MNWAAQAACAGEDNELFFPTIGGKTHQARALCAQCPIQQECLDFAIANRIWDGIWGGLSGAQRRQYDKGAAITKRSGSGRPLLRHTGCLYGDTSSCGTRYGYSKGCRGEHCLARERAYSAEKRQRRKEHQAHEGTATGRGQLEGAEAVDHRTRGSVAGPDHGGHRHEDATHVDLGSERVPVAFP